MSRVFGRAIQSAWVAKICSPSDEPMPSLTPREKQVLAHVRGVAIEGPLGPDAIGRLFERIIDEARRLERRVVHDEVNDERVT